MAGVRVFLKRMLLQFLARASPDSTQAKPRCMMKTRQPPSITHRLFTANIASLGLAGAAASSPRAHSDSAPSIMVSSLFMFFLLLVGGLRCSGFRVSSLLPLMPSGRSAYGLRATLAGADADALLHRKH